MDLGQTVRIPNSLWFLHYGERPVQDFLPR